MPLSSSSWFSSLRELEFESKWFTSLLFSLNDFYRTIVHSASDKDVNSDCDISENQSLMYSLVVS